MLYLQIESPKSSVLNFLDSNSFEVIISIFKGQKRYRIWSVYKEIRRYATIEELDEAVLNRLISKILVSEVKKIDGQKVQEVRIIYNFVGEIPEIIV